MRHQIAQLRHAYTQLKSGVVHDHASFADGLISPAIAEMERSADRIDKLEAALAEIQDMAQKRLTYASIVRLASTARKALDAR